MCTDLTNVRLPGSEEADDLWNGGLNRFSKLGY